MENNSIDDGVNVAGSIVVVICYSQIICIVDGEKLPVLGATGRDRLEFGEA
jgi:hypothetical protein